MRQRTAQPEIKTPTMYRVVFDSISVKIAVSVLFAFLLLQPIAPAFADEIVESAPSEQVADSVAPQEEEIAEEIIPETEAGKPVAEEVVAETLSTQIDTEEVVSEDTESEVSPTNETSNETEAATSTDEADDETEIPNEEEEIATSTDESVDTVTEEEVEEIPTENTDVEEEVVETEVEATTTPEVATSTENVLVVDHNANQLQFNPEECASVGDGAFYCSTPKDSQEFKEDGVFAAPDAGGDMEIFVRLNGEETQLTSNAIDDNAPYYDALSDRIVWHAQYNDRYQIMSYDMRDNEEWRLTDTPYNNMEPVAYGDITMYQAWIDNNWEIMFHDGNELKRLTTNTQHDVSPSIRNGYIVWQSQFADGWQVAVYDQETDHIEYVKSEGGAKVENPRFVLVYDSTNDAGDVQTVGYDFDNKQAFTLNSIPADLPDELPDPDQTGETRALIQNKQSVRGTEIEEKDILPTNTATSTATSTDGLPTLDLTASSSSPVATSTPVVVTIEELVIPSFENATETPEVSHIPDVLIPPSTSPAEIR